jgi:hypothetical protein
LLSELSTKRNERSLLWEGALVTVGVTFLDANAIIPLFIYTYTKSLLLTGLAATISMAASIIVQTLAGPFVGHIQNIPAHLTRVMAVSRPLPFLMIPLLLLRLDPILTVAVFLVLYSIIWCCDGLLMIPWADLYARVIAPGRRGLLMGYSHFLGGVGSLSSGFLIKWALEDPRLSDGERYSIIFGGAGIALTLSLVAMSRAQDHPRALPEGRPDPWSYYRGLPSHLRRNPEFVRTAFSRIFAGFSGIVSPFLIVFGGTQFHLNAARISTLVYLQIIGTLIGSIVWGAVSHRRGNLWVIRLSQAVGFLVPLMALACGYLPGLPDPYLLLCATVVFNGMNTASFIGYLNYTMDVVDPEARPVYLLLNGLLTFPLTFLPFLAGLVANRQGFIPLFIAGGVAAVLGFATSLRLGRERLQHTKTDTPS